ncbi:MAG: M1 family metallopeptidase [Bacteroidota bacterium]|nr:M1 family metallopeptidase [Bacteroidota bacterium]
MIKRLFLPAFALLFVLPASAQEYSDSYPKNPGIDIQGYMFEITVSDDTDVIQGRNHVDARFVEGGQSRLRLDLIGKTAGRDGRGMEVHRVSRGDEELSFAHANDALVIDLGMDVPAGERVKVAVEYSGIPADGMDIGPNKYGDRTFFSDNWSSRVRNWLPVVDHPYDKATTEMIITHPAHYQSTSNGVLKESSNVGNGMRITHWVNDVPTATWLYFIGVAEMAMEVVDTWDGIPIETWVYWQDRDNGFHDFAEPSKAVLAYYSDLIGPYVNKRLGNIVSNATPGGGMEAASIPAYSDKSVSGKRERRWQHVIIHEIAHQWFGNAVTEYHWNDVWLSEGFATYYTLLFREHHYGRDDFYRGLKQSRQSVRNFYQNDWEFALVRPYIEDLNNVSGAMMYQKGAWVLHMLRERLGDVTYHEGIRTYYAEFMNKNAQSADLRRHLEEASGDDLEQFFDQWLFQGGIPQLEVLYWSEDGSNYLSMRQTQPDFEFDFDVEVQYEYADGSMSDVEVIRMPIHEGEMTGANFKWPVEKDIVNVIIDPATKLLADWTVENRKGDWISN